MTARKSKASTSALRHRHRGAAKKSVPSAASDVPVEATRKMLEDLPNILRARGAPGPPHRALNMGRRPIYRGVEDFLCRACP